MEYLSRICFNSQGWRRPTGEAQLLELARPPSFSRRFGYGHEEWLFRFDWQIDGWQYGFLQGVNNSRSTFAGMEEAVDVTLYTCEPGSQRRYVAKILDCECLSYSQSEAIHAQFVANGWLAEMQADIVAVNGDVSTLGNPNWVNGMINVRFRQENVRWYPAGTYAEKDEYVRTLRRYQFNEIKSDAQAPRVDRILRGRSGRPDALNQKPFYRSGSAGKLCTPEHGIIQAKLLDELKAEYPSADISCEKEFVDITVETPSERILFEIKSDLVPRTVLRLALGQLLEYGFYYPWHDADSKRVTLIAVGRKALSPEDHTYLKCLQQKFNLPLKYRVVPI
ncbi:hypothetical protein CYD26_01690 [Pseudomonas sp. FFUP_PS_473]|uniref:hypothetical protein n=1 Tax=Pseudomonas sp. FFUP_PS_473 TaxID=2060418 RepID=UPI000C7AEDB6|nr:hypothetical protein [Pseudomonas sp. FFUP_PS_473]PLP95762.1 hypothetical protein CYD26_01690 [Pseudomonas sp. FFUP_PS_473]